MFSGLPKLADKAFIIGFLVPVLVTVFEVLIAFQECAWLAKTWRTLQSAADLGKVTLLAAAVILSALLLMLINRPLYRVLEGYTGPFALAPLRARALRAANARAATEADLLAARDALPRGDDAWRTANLALRAYRRDVRPRFPQKPALALPTRFGNANRALETYSAAVYDVEAILIWPRLEATLPKSQTAALSDARAQVNCFLNITMLSALVAAARLLGWAGEGAWHTLTHGQSAYGGVSAESFAIGAAGFAALLAITWLAYEMAVERVIALGDQVKVAFDLNLPQLPARLGYKLPAGAEDRKAFWAQLEDAFDFHRPVAGFAWAAAPASGSGADDADAPADDGADEDEGEEGS